MGGGGGELKNVYFYHIMTREYNHYSLQGWLVM
jgi:hypothetical protein